MSSTISRNGERGQTIVLFALAITVILMIAALAFDVGMVLVERRDQQNAADAASLAGARYVIGAAEYHGSCPGPGGNAAVSTACTLAAANGFAGSAVTVHVPPVDGLYKQLPGFIEVQIRTTRPSIFAGVINRTTWGVGSYAVAANQHGLTFRVGLLGLSRTACKAILVAGSGVVNVNADIQSNSTGSDCGGIGFSRTGGGTINVSASSSCRSTSKIQDQGSGTLNCDEKEWQFPLPDPLQALPAVPKPDLAAAIKPQGAWTTIPDYCPGSTDPARRPSEASPRQCVIGTGGWTDRTWVLSPGLYPGGLDIKGNSTLYLLPGIYWIGGGGVSVSSDSDVISVVSETDLTPGTMDGSPRSGVLIYNSTLPATGGAAAPVSLGGSGANVTLLPLDPAPGSPDEIYTDIVIFQDRTVTITGYDLTLNGSASNLAVRGVIYIPSGEVLSNGDAGTVQTVDQIIANMFKVNGNGGTINVLYEYGRDIVISGFGLVE